MNLTDYQRAAVLTWRKWGGVIVSDLPFDTTDEVVDSATAIRVGGKYCVAERLSGAAIDFILSATRAAAEGE